MKSKISCKYGKYQQTFTVRIQFFVTTTIISNIILYINFTSENIHLNGKDQ